MKRNIITWAEKGRKIIEDSNRDITVLEIRQIIDKSERGVYDPYGYLDIVLTAFNLGVAVGYKQRKADEKK